MSNGRGLHDPVNLKDKIIITIIRRCRAHGNIGRNTRDSLHDVRAVSVRPAVHGRRGRRERIRELMVFRHEWRETGRAHVELHVERVRWRHLHGRGSDGLRLTVGQTVGRISLLEHDRCRLSDGLYGGYGTVVTASWHRRPESLATLFERDNYVFG